MKVNNKIDSLKQPQTLPGPNTSPITLHVPGPLLSYPMGLPLSQEEKKNTNVVSIFISILTVFLSMYTFLNNVLFSSF